MPEKAIHGMAKTVLRNITIHDVLETINKKYGDATALQIKEKDGAYRKISYSRLGKRTVDTSSALIRLGLEKGDRVAILSESRPEWVIAFFGIISCGGITVPIDIKLAEREIQFILNDSEVKHIFISGKYIETIDNLKTVLPHLKDIIVFDDIGRNDVILLKDLRIRAGYKKYNPIYPDDTALIVYTSGTTGVAKGVELSCRNLLFQVIAISEIVHYSAEDQFLSILPLNHMLEITGGLIAPLYAGSCVTYCESVKTATLVSTMKETRTTAIICVPLVLKMIYDGIMKKAGRMPSLKRRVFYLLLAVSRALLVYNVRAGKILFKSVHDEFGGRLRGFVSGGAPLNPDIERDLNALGFRALQGYGLTETAPVISLNTYKHCKIGSVGRPIKGVEVKILKETGAADEGEIATRGPHVMKGYYKNPEKTANVIKNGWFLTGDIGYLDKDGFLHISGRLRNLIVLGTGKKVFPEEVEEVLGQSPYIKEICVLGVKSAHGAHRGHEEVSAVIVPNADMFNEADRNDEKRVRATISSEIARLSHALAAYKRIVSFEISFEELPKTATKKIRRNEVADRLGRMSARRRE